MQLGSIIRYKEESLLYFLTFGVQEALWKHKLPRKSGLTIYWMGRVGLWKTSRSKIDLRLVPYKNLVAFYEN